MSNPKVMADDGIYRPYLGDTYGDTEHPNEQCRRVLKVVAKWDWSRIDIYGGYPSEVSFVSVFENGATTPVLVAVASIDSSREPDLTLLPIQEFLDHYEYDEDEDDPLPRSDGTDET